jgi:hypothetical protein
MLVLVLLSNLNRNLANGVVKTESKSSFPFYRNFKVTSVAMAKMMPTIQKRVTILASW